MWRDVPLSGLTGDEVLRLLEDKRIVRDLRTKLPTRPACDRLAQLINGLRADWFHWVLYSGSNEETEWQQTATALETLSNVLPALRHTLTREEMETDLPIVDQLAQAVEAARARPWGTQPVKRANRWHDFAAKLAEAFREAMHSTNPGLKIGLTDDGPLARFLEAVIPEITSEHPERPAIVRYVSRSSDKTKAVRG